MTLLDTALTKQQGIRRSTRRPSPMLVAALSSSANEGSAGDPPLEVKKAAIGRRQKRPAQEEQGEENMASKANDEVMATKTSRPARKRVAKDQKVEVPAEESEEEGSKKKGSKKKGGKKEAKEPIGLAPDKEKGLHAKGFDFVYGIDEAGRGPLAGPVVAAACYVPPDLVIPGIQDSKQMDEEARERVYAVLMSTKGIIHAVSIVDNTRIDEINILQATLQGMRESLNQCLTKHKPNDKIYALVDGNRDPGLSVGAELMIKGDSRVRCIAAASIIAKVTRDRIMLEHDKAYPQYGFKQHKGYPTPAHKMAIYKHGPCPLHRMTFRPIRKDD